MRARCNRFVKGTGRFLAHETQGVSALEFALISPVLLTLTMGAVELSLVSYAQAVMESATFNAARLGKTGFVAGSTRQEGIINMIVTRSNGLLQASKFVVTSSSFASFAGSGGTGTNGLGNAGEVVVYNISYPWKVSTPLIGKLFGSQATVNLTTRAVVKNEPF